MRIKFVGEPAQHLPGGPIWETGEEQDLADDEAAVYLRNVNWQRVGTKAKAAEKDRSPAEEQALVPDSTPPVEQSVSDGASVPPQEG